MIKPLHAVTLNASTFTAINLGPDPNIKSITLQCDGSTDVYLSDTSAGTNFFTLKSGTSLFMDIRYAIDIVAKDVIFAKAASATPKLQILGWY